MKKFINDFKNFAVKGNAFDLAVGVVIGGAFGKIVTSFVNDIITPFISLLTNTSDLAQSVITLRGGENPVYLSYGSFLQSVIDFLIIAFSIFLVIRLLSRLQRTKEVEEEKKAPVKSDETVLLEEILTELRKK